MAKKKKDLGIARPAMGLVGGAAVLGMGSQVVTGVGGDASGMTTAAGYMPMIGSTIGAGLTIKQLRKLQKQKK